jgi:hypothetical protein
VGRALNPGAYDVLAGRSSRRKRCGVSPGCGGMRRDGPVRWRPEAAADRPALHFRVQQAGRFSRKELLSGPYSLMPVAGTS